MLLGVSLACRAMEGRSTSHEKKRGIPDAAESGVGSSPCWIHALLPLQVDEKLAQEAQVNVVHGRTREASEAQKPTCPIHTAFALWPHGESHISTSNKCSMDPPITLREDVTSFEEPEIHTGIDCDSMSGHRRNMK